jgi:ApeA N-terminal domain 1
MKKIKIEGKWWVHGPDEHPHFGTLTYDEEGSLSLEVKIPQNLSVDAAMQQSFNEGVARVPDVLLGEDSHNRPVTLFGCMALPATSAGLLTYRIDALAGVQGLEFQSWSQPRIRAVSLKVHVLHRWLGGGLIETVNRPGDRPAFRPLKETDLLLNACRGVRLRIARCIGSSSSQDEYRLRPIHRVWLHFGKPQSLAQVSDEWLHKVTRLFSLLIGDPVDYDEAECYFDDPWRKNFKGVPTEGKLLRRGKRRSPSDNGLHTLAMLAPFPQIEKQFKSIVQSWFRVAAELEPVVDLFSAVAFRHSLHSNAEFLALVQALEVYQARLFNSKALPTKEHNSRVKAVVSRAPKKFRTWTQQKLESANYKYLDERLREVFESHKPEVERLFPNLAELPEKIRYTRNYLTHYTGKIDSRRYLKPSEMVEVSWYLRIFLWICLLKQIGVSGKPIERLIRRYGDVKFINLQ